MTPCSERRGRIGGIGRFGLTAFCGLEDRLRLETKRVEMRGDHGLVRHILLAFERAREGFGGKGPGRGALPGEHDHGPVGERGVERPEFRMDIHWFAARGAPPLQIDQTIILP